MSHIIDKLYLGSRNDALSESFMTETDTAVLNVAYDAEKSPYCINYLHIPLEDTYDERILPHFDTAIHFIRDNLENNVRVLVHCVAGISRSPPFVICYLMAVYGMTYGDAHKKVKEKRPIIDPNTNFHYQLYAYEQILKQRYNVLTVCDDGDRN